DQLINDESTPAAIKKKLAGMSGEDKEWQPEELASAKMAVGEWLQRNGGNRNPRNVLLDGEPAVVMIDDAGNAFHEDNSPVMGKLTPYATNEGGVVGGVNSSGQSKNTIEFQDAAIGAVGAVQLGTEMLISSESNPESLGVPGGFMRWGANFVSGANALADWAGMEYEPGTNVEQETEIQQMGYGGFNYGKLDTDKLGVSGAEAEKFRAGVYGIAFAAAVAEQGTRPTDKDIQQFIDQIGGRATSAQSFRET
ncbi:unnamed protein product, partial [marine sediment metagenome]